jgi:hypothetical protein
LLGAGAASAGTLVEFPNLPGHTPANLSGYLARPDSGLSAELGYNEGAPKDAAEKTRAFLAAHLAETSPGEPTAK